MPPRAMLYGEALTVPKGLAATMALQPKEPT
jgi:hypothetical protein